MLNVKDSLMLQIKSQTLKIKSWPLRTSHVHDIGQRSMSLFPLLRSCAPTGRWRNLCNSAVFTKNGTKKCLSSPKFHTKNWVIVKNYNEFTYYSEAKNSQLIKTEIWNNGDIQEKMGLESFLNLKVYKYIA